MTSKHITLITLAFLISGCASAEPLAPPTFEVTETESKRVKTDQYLSDFYVAPALMPKISGHLIRQETLAQDQAIDGAADNVRLLYSSTEGIADQGIIAVSGTLHLPNGDAPDGGWPLLVWSHGTVGVSDLCTPSWSKRSPRDLAYLSYWLGQGYAVAASDYQGLGTIGTHPYMAVRPMAYNNLDLIRAVQAADFPVSSAVVITGQSQGASASISTAIFAEEYAPEIDLRAVVATGVPYFSEEILMAMEMNADLDAVDPILGLTVYGLTLSEMMDPDFHLRDVVTENAWPTISEVGNACVFDFIGKTMQAGLSPRTTFSAPIQAAQRATISAVNYPTLKLDVPLFVGTGEVDQITPATMQGAFVRDACAAGSTIVSRVYPGATHNTGLGLSKPDSERFIQDAFAGRTILNECG